MTVWDFAHAHAEGLGFLFALMIVTWGAQKIF